MKEFRKLKIHSKFRTRTWDNTTVPEIRLEGRWLEGLGFKEGEQIQIEQQPNKLIITLYISPALSAVFQDCIRQTNVECLSVSGLTFLFSWSRKRTILEIAYIAPIIFRNLIDYGKIQLSRNKPFH